MTLTTTKADSYRKWKTLVTQQRIDRNTQFRSDNKDKKISPEREKERERERERDSTTHDARYKSIHKQAGPQQQHRTTTISASVGEAHDNNNTIILHGHTHTQTHTHKNCYEHTHNTHVRTQANWDKHNTQFCAHTIGDETLNKCEEAMRTRTTP
jgi:hypothetical protein